ncbi:unnamed protein product [Dicrocoelium dendriticum]|nr:unnamed protein product [Dicrocoelium dendriticum]
MCISHKNSILKYRFSLVTHADRSSSKQPKMSESLTPHNESGYLYDAIKMLTQGARSFVKMLEEINNKNYKSVAEILSRHSSSR